MKEFFGLSQIQTTSIQIIEKLCTGHKATESEYAELITNRNAETIDYARQKAVEFRKSVYGDKVYLRGLIEISNICRNNCYYCGIRRSNKNCDRYALSKEDILNCCKTGYSLGFRTFVLQSGEGALSVEDITETVSEIKNLYPDCAVTLSLGEYSKEEYALFKKAGADRYLLRHETADKEHYKKLHPDMNFDNRMRCLYELKELNFQVGCGFMVGSPFQTAGTLAKDLKFIEEFKPDMCGIGPFIPQKDTPFANEAPGSAELTCFLLSIIRIIQPNILLPATTALGSISPLGREEGLKSGANVLMPNLSPTGVRDKYILYDGKICTGEESAQCIKCLETRISSTGYKLSFERGDIKLI